MSRSFVTVQAGTTVKQQPVSTSGGNIPPITESTESKKTRRIFVFVAPGFNSQYPNGQIWDDTTRCFIDALHAADDPDDGVAIVPIRVPSGYLLHQASPVDPPPRTRPQASGHRLSGSWWQRLRDAITAPFTAMGRFFSGLFGRARSLVQNVRQYHQLEDPDSLPSRNIQEFVRGQLAGHHYDSDRDNARWLGYSGGGQPGLTTAAVLRGQGIRFDRVVTVGSPILTNPLDRFAEVEILSVTSASDEVHRCASVLPWVCPIPPNMDGNDHHVWLDSSQSVEHDGYDEHRPTVRRVIGFLTR
ncbi:MAG: hypothetical protein KC474_04010 [Cyanobacteria bacterium HKST-UBA04]|nr:hypothetical protein [Cyanobacteria bacterium HKST-UBA04]